MKREFFTVVYNREVARQTYEMVMQGDTSDITAPGQFINIRLKDLYLRRPISISSYKDGELTIIYKIQGIGTKNMSELPSGEVLRDVIRVHTHRTVGGKEIAAGDGQDIRALKNNILSCAADSIEHFLSADTAQTVVDTYRWFAAGYRYPILRTVRVSDTDGNTLSLAAYYFSPERQSELSDPDNERIRRQQQDDSGETDANGKESGKTDSPIDYSVNVSGHSITIDYSLRAAANVRALLCDVRGMVYKSHTAANPAGSDYRLTLDCTGLRPGEYVLYLNVNGVVSSGKVRLQ